ncbi:acyl-CoA dehydrogenase [Mesorhizobium sp. CAU 1741]|uniref:acyl-CoA dehydrogenase family protein n=1 Tax=Mesorhizobium sp. CAU 1741 TaxID=3140366 RepID=UPI00325BFFB2
MDITLTDEQRMLQETAAAFARDVSDAARSRRLEAGEASYDKDVWTQMAELGLAGAPLSSRHGGSELSMLELGLIVEAMGANALASPLFSSIVEAGMLLADCAPEGVQDKWLPHVAQGDKTLTVAYLETQRNYDTAIARTTLHASGNGHVLNGAKRFVRDAGSADAIICSATAQGGGTVLAIVDAQSAGVRLERMPAAGGEALWAVELDSVSIAEDAVVRGNDISGALERLGQRGAALKACELVGIGQAALDLTVEYAKGRKQFGVAIGSFQAVQHHCAEIYRDISITRLLARSACAAIDNAADAQRAVSFAKAKASASMTAATRIAHQVHGAVAFYRDYPLELYYHRAIAAQAAYGDTMHHKRVLGAMLASDPSRFRGMLA